MPLDIPINGRVNQHQIKSGLTRERIMDAAEPLFVTTGLAGTSMRQIAAAAEVDLSLVAYHFRSKLGLYNAILDRAVVALSSERSRRLSLLEEAAAAPTLDQLFDILILSWFEIAFSEKPYKATLMLNIMNIEHNPYDSPEWPSDAFVKRFIAKLRTIVPDMPIGLIHWNYHIFTGAIVHFLSAPMRIKRLSHELCAIDSPDEIRAHLLRLVHNLYGD